MWWDVVGTSGNDCQIQRFVDVGVLHSHRAYLRSALYFGSLRMVYLLQRDIIRTI